MSFGPSDEYLTITGPARTKTKVEGSTFVATAVRVNSEEEAKGSILEISKEFFDATHNCYAFRIKNAHGESERFSDSGEPRGTAGTPILRAIQSEDLYNVLVVVTRYFGGVKLGAGGLSRAYRRSARSVLQKADKASRLITSEVSLSYPAGASGKVSQIFAKYDIRVKDQGFDDSPTAKVEVRMSLVDKIKKALVEATNGQVKFKEEDQV